MIYAYIRNQEKREARQAENEKERDDLIAYAQMSGWTIDKWYFGKHITTALRQMKQGDILLISEISCLGNSLRSVQKLINESIYHHWKIIITRDNYIFDDSLSSQLLATAMETTMKIIADIKSQNMRKRLQELRCQGKKFGRPLGSCNKELKLNAKEDVVRQLLIQNVSKSEIARRLGVNRMTLYTFLRKIGI
ncbi:MAG: hypothetical protein E7010_01345 [Alphaproteobacteria bacterium]|nr:hypothetical protein [Alphaproteobacteria bacterium]